MNQEAIVDLLLSRLAAELPRLTDAFERSRVEVGVRYGYVDDLLPPAVAEQIHAAFPAPERMRAINSFRERKYTSKSFDQFDPILAAITFAMQDRRVVQLIEQATGLAEQLPDSSLYAGGISTMLRGDFLGPHIDNSHEASRCLYRTLNLLYYVSPDWRLPNGGHLELWDRSVRERVTVESRFNRLVIMETTPTSWHSVSKVQIDAARCCVSNYYFSPQSPTGLPYAHVTSFSAWPEQRFLRLVARADNCIRQAIRRLVPGGVGKVDVYKGPKR